MSKQRTVILFVILVNFGIGRVFHESLDLVCISELFIIAGTSFLFWTVSLPYLKLATVRLQSFTQHKNLLLHSGLGLSASLLNVLFSQVVIIGVTLYLYQCTTTPSFSFINASLTNNIGINLFGYAFLAHFLIHELKESDPSRAEHPTVKGNGGKSAVKTIPNKIVLSSNSQKAVVDFGDIRFIEASNNCIVLHTQKGKFAHYQSLRSFLLEYPYPRLRRVHRSYAVNLDFISSIEKNKNGDGLLHLTTEQVIKFSRNYKEAFVG